MTPEPVGADHELTENEVSGLTAIRDMAEEMHAAVSAAMGLTDGGVGLEGRSFVVFKVDDMWAGTVLRVDDAELIPVVFR